MGLSSRAQDRLSLRVRGVCTIIHYLTLLISSYVYWRHNTYCEPYSIPYPLSHIPRCSIPYPLSHTPRCSIPYPTLQYPIPHAVVSPYPMLQYPNTPRYSIQYLTLQYPHTPCLSTQWNPSNVDMSCIERFPHFRGKFVAYLGKCSLIQRCPHFRGVLLPSKSTLNLSFTRESFKIV